MHPLTRQPTPASVLSYWSDRNPPGPTINLHAAAKPLMRFMYHREALEFIRRNGSTPLSSKDMQIYSTYLGYKYVSSSTKVAILRELQTRVESESDACVFADTLGLHLDTLLGSADAEIRRSMCCVLVVLARHATTVPAVLRGKPCDRLVILLRDENREVSTSAAQALYILAYWPEGAQAAVDANVLDCLGDFMESALLHLVEWQTKWSWKMLVRLARRPVTARGVVGQLLSMMHGENLFVISNVVPILELASISSDGAQAVLDGNVGDCVAELLESPKAEVWRSACWMLERLVQSPNTALAGVCVRFCPRLVLLLRGSSDALPHPAWGALRQISASPTGAQAVVDAGVLRFVSAPRGSSGSWRLMWDLLEQLAVHEITVRAAVVATTSLMRRSGHDSSVIDNALKLWTRVTRSSEGAQAIVDAGVLEFLPDLLRLERRGHRYYTCTMLEQLMSQDATARVTGDELTSLFRSGDLDMVERATEVLYLINNSALGMRDFLHANIADCLTPLLERSNSDRRTGHWEHQLSSPSAVAQLVVPLRHESYDVREAVDKFVNLAATAPDGALAVVDTHMLEYAVELLESPKTGVQVWTCKLLAGLAWHESTRDAVLRPDICMRLVSLLSAEPIVRRSAVRTLAGMSQFPAGIEAVGATDFLEQISTMHPPDWEVQRLTGVILINLVRYHRGQLRGFE
ncbi:armadillo-type protein [Mycena latifolia]|nr:armadillo-type protein [Mycena latifolia]